jgi:hypothetical protein
MTDLNVLVLTDDELTCISGANKRAWPLPLGGDRNAEIVETSALAGERSLFARGLIGRRDGEYGLAAAAHGYLHPCLQGDPEVVVCVVDDQLRWVLQGMSLAVYREDGVDVLEARAANGLHHFTQPRKDDLRAALRNYVTSAHEAGFPDAMQGVDLALYVAVPAAGRAFRVEEGAVTETALKNTPLSTEGWTPSSLEAALECIDANG